MPADSQRSPGGVVPDSALSTLLLRSYRRVVGQPLVPGELDEAQAGHWLYEDAPFCVLAHSTDSDPIFIYANKAAQRCFEYSWKEFVIIPSRLSAEAPNRADRQMLLDQVTRNGFVTNYAGVRVSRSGRRFFVENATVWQLLNDEGVVQGQGAMLPSWRDMVAT
jgi:hypothetical protein